MRHEIEYKRLKKELEILDKLPTFNIQDENFPNILKSYRNNNISRNKEKNSNMPNNNVQNKAQITTQIIYQSSPKETQQQDYKWIQVEISLSKITQ